MMTIDELLAEAQHLSTEERKELAKQLLDTLEAGNQHPEKHNLTELRGLGKEVWRDVDTESYVNTLRDEWDTRS